MRETATSWVVGAWEAGGVVQVVLTRAASSYDHDKSNWKGNRDLVKITCRQLLWLGRFLELADVLERKVCTMLFRSK
jgi:hypothetical protein